MLRYSFRVNPRIPLNSTSRCFRVNTSIKKRLFSTNEKNAPKHRDPTTLATYFWTEDQIKRLENDLISFQEEEKELANKVQGKGIRGVMPIIGSEHVIRRRSLHRKLLEIVEPHTLNTSSWDGPTILDEDGHRLPKWLAAISLRLRIPYSNKVFLKGAADAFKTIMELWYKGEYDQIRYLVTPDFQEIFMNPILSKPRVEGVKVVNYQAHILAASIEAIFLPNNAFTSALGRDDDDVDDKFARIYVNYKIRQTFEINFRDRVTVNIPAVLGVQSWCWKGKTEDESSMMDDADVNPRWSLDKWEAIIESSL